MSLKVCFNVVRFIDGWDSHTIHNYDFVIIQINISISDRVHNTNTFRHIIILQLLIMLIMILIIIMYIIGEKRIIYHIENSRDPQLMGVNAYQHINVQSQFIYLSTYSC